MAEQEADLLEGIDEGVLGRHGGRRLSGRGILPGGEMGRVAEPRRLGDERCTRLAGTAVVVVVVAVVVVVIGDLRYSASSWSFPELDGIGPMETTSF